MQANDRHILASFKLSLPILNSWFRMVGHRRPSPCSADLNGMIGPLIVNHVAFNSRARRGVHAAPGLLRGGQERQERQGWP